MSSPEMQVINLRDEAKGTAIKAKFFAFMQENSLVLAKDEKNELYLLDTTEGVAGVAANVGVISPLEAFGNYTDIGDD